MCWFDRGLGPNTQVNLINLISLGLDTANAHICLFIFPVAILVKAAFVWQKLFMVLLLILLAR